MLRLACRLARRGLLGLMGLPRAAATALGAPAPGSAAPTDNRRLVRGLLLTIPSALLGNWAVGQLVWVRSPSIDAWAVRPAPGPPGRGDYVMFMLSHPLAGPVPVSVTKKILCLPGEMLIEMKRPALLQGVRGDSAYYCGDHLLGVSKAFSATGRRLDHLEWGVRPIPPGYVYVGSDHPSGFDSRYYGPVAITRLTRMARIL